MKSILKFIFVFFLFFIFTSAVSLAGVFLYFRRDLPDPTQISKIALHESTKIYDRSGEQILYEIHGEEKRTVISRDEIPSYVKAATVVAEDANFWNHSGFSVKSILRALVVNILEGKFTQGGSTITQQLVKNAFLGRQKTIARKIKEVMLAYEIEKNFSKEEILELYLNQISYGSNAYGIEAAAETFFGKKTESLSVSEAALLASLPKAPTYYSPYGSNFKELKNRQEFILERMKEFGYINEEDYRKNSAIKINFLPQREKIQAPHFIMYVRDYLTERYGENFLEQGGLKVHTTIDTDLQKIAEKTIKEGAAQNEKLFKAKNAALTAIDPKTGQILAMVGSRDYFDLKNEGNFNVATANRQPGSAFKPFAYTLAFKKGLRPETTLFDVFTEFNPLCDSDGKPKEGVLISQEKCYHPQNYDEKYRGPISLREALAQSINVPAVKTLYIAGINKTINLAQDMGITTLKNRDRYGLSLVLGGGEVKLIDLVAAYGVFANDGSKHPKTAILKIEDKNGNIIEEYKNNSFQIIDPEIARTISDILSDNNARTPIFGPASPLYFEDRQVAAKTGTSQDYRDAWTVGYTPEIVVGVWVGNNDNSPLVKSGGGAMAAAPIWHNFLKEVLKDKQTTFLPKPMEKEIQKPILSGSYQNIKKISIDTISGLIATSLTPPEFIEERAYQDEPHSILYFINKDDILGPVQENPSQDSQFENWEAGIKKWLASRGGFIINLPPQDFDNIHTEENRPKIISVSPFSNSRFFGGINIPISVAVESLFEISKIDFFANGEIFESLKNSPWQANFQGPAGQYLIQIRIFDKFGNQAEASLTLFIDS
ncbi:MAG: PBP1A family penicillin-binding protein [Parcubacteria group bacterium]|nr:PBP1A family penicillin-binding protein [Parcubacteria group bacterium]